MGAITFLSLFSDVVLFFVDPLAIECRDRSMGLQVCGWECGDVIYH